MAEALLAGLVPIVAFVLSPEDAGEADMAGSEVITVTERVMAKMSSTQHPRGGPIAVLSMPDLADRPSGSAVVLWGVSDPGNVGTAIRSAVAFGTSIVLGPGCADLWGPKVLRAAAGAHFAGSVVHAPALNIQQLRTWGVRVVAAVPRGGAGLGQLATSPSAVLVGGEGAGLPAEIIESCDGLLTIEMPGGSESLNAGVCASLMAYELARTPAGDPR